MYNTLKKMGTTSEQTTLGFNPHFFHCPVPIFHKTGYPESISPNFVSHSIHSLMMIMIDLYKEVKNEIHL